MPPLLSSPLSTPHPAHSPLPPFLSSLFYSPRYAPGRITNMGSAIPKTKGVPRFTVLNDFVACEEPDPNMVHRKFRCTESTRKPNAAVKVCIYSDLREWSDADG